MYIVDSNILIEAKDRYYGLDFAPGFWEWLVEARHAGRVFSVTAVRDEVEGRGDELSEWSRSAGRDLYLSPRSTVAGPLTELARWANRHDRYTASAEREFLASADYTLVAQACDLGYTVVTHETPSPDSRRRIKIPEACAAVGVPCCTPWQVLRTEGARLVRPAA
ncbi:DUF4411 family protein [Sanguibacter sp. Leaf3]|uniref:DUF4411 family protein n=1 Tax=Sanguibacter sp. Leaf3 TaxID=1736209 RepID=UPI0009E6AFE1|nr:DUF4411 family protein [Sanguibacter sp. Leaf3]